MTDQPETTTEATETAAAAPSVAAPADDDETGPEGCYLTYESDSGGKLMLFYSKGEIPDNAVGFWTSGGDKKIQGFKFKQHGGRSELIKGIAGGDANRRKYFVGWCQFVKLAKQFHGKLIKFPGADQGVEVDVYGYTNVDQQPQFLEIDKGMVDVSQLNAVAVVPMHNNKFKGIKSLQAPTFLEWGNLAGASTTL